MHAVAACQRDDTTATFPLLDCFDRLPDERRDPIIAHTDYPDLRRNSAADTVSMISGGTR